MFRFLDPATFGANETENEATLRKLGEAMVAEFDAPKDGADEEERARFPHSIPTSARG